MWRNGFVFGFGEFPQQLFLPRIQSLWCFDRDLDKLVADPAGSQVRQALSLYSEDTAILRAGRDFQASWPIQARHLNRCAESRLRKTQGHDGDKIVTVALEEFVRLDSNVAVEVSSWSGIATRLAFAGYSYALSLMNTGGNLDADDSFLRYSARALAFLAGIRNDLAAAPALRAG
jgi:hypothetical protein